MRVHSNFPWLVIGLAVLMIVLSDRVHADHETETYWDAGYGVFTSQASACASIPKTDDTADRQYSGWTVEAGTQYPNRCREEVTYCSYTHLSIEDCNGATTTGHQSTLINFGSRVKAHEPDPDPNDQTASDGSPEETCAAIQGQSRDIGFSANADGHEEPDFSCLSNGCAADASYNVQTAYDEFGQAESYYYSGTATFTGQTCSAAQGTPEGDPPPPEQPYVNPTDEEPPPPPPPPAECTGDYYTSPSTGEIVCGQPGGGGPDPDPDPGTTDGGDPGTTDGGDPGTTDGGDPGTTDGGDPGATDGGGTAGGGGTTDGGTTDGGETPDECPSNTYKLVNGQQVCQDTAGTDEEAEERTASGGGSCDAAPSCSGDPINCAILQGVWTQRCEAEQPSEAEFQEAAGVTGLSTPGEIEAALYGEETALGEAAGLDGNRFDDAGFLGGTRSCPTAPSFTAWGQTFELDWSLLCDGAEVFGLLVLIGGTWVSTRVLFG